jgi:hypothetical protein
MNCILRLSMSAIPPAKEQMSLQVGKPAVTGSPAGRSGSQMRIGRPEWRHREREREVENEKTAVKNRRRLASIMAMQPLDSIPRVVEAIDVSH